MVTNNWCEDSGGDNNVPRQRQIVDLALLANSNEKPARWRHEPGTIASQPLNDEIKHVSMAHGARTRVWQKSRLVCILNSRYFYDRTTLTTKTVHTNSVELLVQTRKKTGSAGVKRHDRLHAKVSGELVYRRSRGDDKWLTVIQKLDVGERGGGSIFRYVRRHHDVNK